MPSTNVGPGSARQPVNYGTPNKNVGSKVNSGLNSNSRAMGSTAGNGFGGGASYRTSAGGYGDDAYESSYNPANYGGGGGMSQPRQTLGSGSKSTAMLGTPQRTKGMIPKDLLPGKYDSPGANSTYGGAGGFGMKSPNGKTSSSLANAGKMAMQTNYNYGSPGQSQSQTGLRQGYRY